MVDRQDQKDWISDSRHSIFIGYVFGVLVSSWEGKDPYQIRIVGPAPGGDRGEARNFVVMHTTLGTYRLTIDLEQDK